MQLHETIHWQFKTADYWFSCKLSVYTLSALIWSDWTLSELTVRQADKKYFQSNVL